LSVTVDHEPFDVQKLKIQTIGQVLAHLQKDHRLVTQVLIDGEEATNGFRSMPVDGHSIFIETSDPRELALEVLDETASRIQQSDAMKSEAAELLQKNQPNKAFERLSSCIRAWHDGQEALLKTAELLRVDLTTVMVEEQQFEEVLADFTANLRSIRGALDQRDFVLLGDVLLYETAEMTGKWLAAINALRDTICAIR
jgi:hypothetical protein